MNAHQHRKLPPTRSGRLFYVAAMTAALIVGALQMYQVHAGFLTNYGADVFGTAWMYTMTRLGRTVVQRGRTTTPGVAAGSVFLLCAVSEYGQRLHLVPGHYDPYDLLAFAATVIACVAVDRGARSFVQAPVEVPQHAAPPNSIKPE